MPKYLTQIIVYVTIAYKCYRLLHRSLSCWRALVQLVGHRQLQGRYDACSHTHHVDCRHTHILSHYVVLR